MKTLVLSIIIMVPSVCMSFTYKETKHMKTIRIHDDEIDVYLDPSLEQVGDASDVYVAIHDCFIDWIELGEIPIIVNLIKGKCDRDTDGKNCVRAQPIGDYQNKSGAATTTNIIDEWTGESRSAQITFFTDYYWKFEDGIIGTDFRHAALHEIGHMFGLWHSAEISSVMYETMYLESSVTSDLGIDDIAGAQYLYKDRDSSSEYDYALHTACSFSVSNSKNLLSLFLGMW